MVAAAVAAMEKQDRPLKVAMRRRLVQVAMRQLLSEEVAKDLEAAETGVEEVAKDLEAVETGVGMRHPPLESRRAWKEAGSLGATEEGAEMAET